MLEIFGQLGGKFNFFIVILSTALQAYQFEIYCGFLSILTGLVNI